MRFYDVSVRLSETTPTYPGDPRIEITSWKSLANGDPSNVSLLYMGAHSGTHVDAPAHLIEGAGRVESLPLEALIGEAQVITVPENVTTIDASFTAAHHQPGRERVLFKTRNSNFWSGENPVFHSDFAHIDLGAAEYLVSQGTKLVGIDYLSIERFKSKTHETHVALLSKGIVILEGLDLREVGAGIYELICLPLRIAGGIGDGSPVRAILRTLD